MASNIPFDDRPEIIALCSEKCQLLFCDDEHPDCGYSRALRADIAKTKRQRARDKQLKADILAICRKLKADIDNAPIREAERYKWREYKAAKKFEREYQKQLEDKQSEREIQSTIQV